MLREQLVFGNQETMVKPKDNQCKLTKIQTTTLTCKNNQFKLHHLMDKSYAEKIKLPMMPVNALIAQKAL